MHWKCTLFCHFAVDFTCAAYRHVVIRRQILSIPTIGSTKNPYNGGCETFVLPMAAALKDVATCSSPPLNGGSEGAGSLSAEDEEGWEDVEQEPDYQQPIVSLFTDEAFPDVLAMLEHCKQKHGFDLLRARKELGVYVSQFALYIFATE